jgi:PPOX class probable F420-dependent enzyme
MTGLTDEAARLLASEPLIAHLSTCRDDRPHVAPVWYDVVDDGIEIVTTGRKLANLRANPRLSLSVVREASPGHPEWHVTVRGTATVVDSEAASREATRRINRRYGADHDAWMENVLVRIDVGSASVSRYG